MFFVRNKCRCLKYCSCSFWSWYWFNMTGIEEFLIKNLAFFSFINFPDMDVVSHHIQRWWYITINMALNKQHSINFLSDRLLSIPVFVISTLSAFQPNNKELFNNVKKPSFHSWTNSSALVSLLSPSNSSTGSDLLPDSNFCFLAAGAPCFVFFWKFLFLLFNALYFKIWFLCGLMML